MSVPVIPYIESDLVYRSNDIKKPDIPPLIESHVIDESKYFVTEDTPLNKRNFMYQPCAANISLEKLKYCSTEYFDSPTINLMDRSDKLGICEEDGSVSVNECSGWRSGRSDVCLKEGKIYWEVDVKHLSSNAHIRCGISRREASTETPVGCDFYGYGVRDIGLQTIHEGKLHDKLKSYNLKQGDRLGFLLILPPVEKQVEQAMEYSSSRISEINNKGKNSAKRNKKLNREFNKFLLRNCDPENVIRDQIAIRYKSQLFFESTDYVKTTKPEYYDSNNKDDTLKYYELDNSSLEVFVNGESHGIAFTNLTPFLPPFSELQYNEKFYIQQWNRSPFTKGIEIRNKYVNNNRLGYYATVSSFQGGAASIVSDKSKLKFIPNDGEIKTLSEIYEEQIASDIVWDLVDEVDLELSIANV